MATFQLQTQMTGGSVRTSEGYDERSLRRDMAEKISSGCCAFAKLVNRATGEVLHSYGAAR